MQLTRAHHYPNGCVCVIRHSATTLTYDNHVITRGKGFDRCKYLRRTEFFCCLFPISSELIFFYITRFFFVLGKQASKSRGVEPKALMKSILQPFTNGPVANKMGKVYFSSCSCHLEGSELLAHVCLRYRDNDLSNET